MRWLPVLVTSAVLAAAVAAVQLMPPNDFAPFTMRIDVYALAPGYSGTAELRYLDRANWQIRDPSDEYIYACNDGLYGHFERTGAFVITDPGHAYPCPGPNRWIAYGMARAVPWEKSVAGDVVTYTNTGERVAFDLKTGLPLVYETGPSGGPATQRTIYTLVK